MVSKNNHIGRMTKTAERKPHFAIRKLTIGAASVLLGTLLWMSTTASTSHADTVDGSSDESHQESGTQVMNDTGSAKKVVVTTNNGETPASTNATDEEQSSANEGATVKQNANTTDAAKETTVKENDAAEQANKVLTQNAKDNTAKVAKSTDDSIGSKIESAGQQGKTDTIVSSTSQNNSTEATTDDKNKASTTVAADVNKKQTTDTTTENQDKKIKIKITGIDDYDGSTLYGKLDDSFKADQVGINSNDYVFYNYVGYKLMNPEALDGLDLKYKGYGHGNLIVPDHDVDITLHFAKLANTKVEYVDTKGNVLAQHTDPSNASTSESLYSSEDGIHTSRILARAIDIPGYELVSAPEVTKGVTQVATKDNPNEMLIQFVYKQIAPNAQEGLPNGGGTEINGSTQHGIDWSNLPGSVNIDLVNPTYGVNHFEQTVKAMQDRYTKQGFSFVGIVNDHKDSDPTNRLESYVSVQFLPHQNVTVNYVDENGNKLSDSTILSFNQANPNQANNGIDPTNNWFANGEWKSSPKQIKGYVLKETKGATEGKFTTFGYNVTYVYTNQAAGSVSYIDDTENNKVLATDKLNGKIGENITYSTADRLKDYENLGYVVVSNNYDNATHVFDGDDTKNQFVIHLKHGTRPVNPDQPVGPQNPVDPTHPDNPNNRKNIPGLTKEDLEKSVTRNFHYIFSDNSSHPEVTEAPQTVKFTGSGVIDMVTGGLVTVDKDGNITGNGEIVWTPKDALLPAVATKTVSGYHVVSAVNANQDGSVSAQTVTPITGNIDVTVVYAPDAPKQAEKASLHLVDISDNNKEINTFTDSGKDNTAISFNGAQATIDAYVKAGYKVNGIVQATSDPNAPIKYGTDYASTSSKWSFDDQPGVDQSFYVYLEHDYAPINPTNNYGRTDLTREVTETVHYVDEATGKPVATDYTNKVTFNAQGRVDKVTGKMLAIKSIENNQITYDYDVANEIDIATAKASDFAWSNPVTFAKAVSPVINGYTIDAAKTTPSDLADGNDIKKIANIGYNHANVEATVYYKANPVEIHKAELTIYANGQQVGTASATGAKDTAIDFGEIGQTVEAYINNGWKFDHAQDITNNTVMAGKSYSELNFGKYLTENNSDQKFAIYLTKAAEPTQQTAQLIINDVTPGQTMQLGNYTQPGLEGSAISFDGVSAQIANLLAKGYVWDGATYNGANLDAKDYAGIQFGNYDKTDDKNTISQKWVINLVHGFTPVNPDHPDDKDGYTKEYLDKTITRDVTYVDGQGNTVAKAEHQETNFKGSGYLDNVTNRWVTVENGKITGVANGLTWTPDEDQTFDAIGAKTVDGYHVVSVGGNNVNGFLVGQDGSVGQQTVGRDTASSTIKVVYAKDSTPVTDKGSIIVTVHDATTNTDLSEYGKQSGESDVGTKFTYDKTGTITELTNKGYKVLNPEITIPTEITKGSHTFTIVVEHTTTTVTPDKPGKPGEPVDPSNPEGPKYPTGTDENAVKRTGTQTIKYTGAGDKTPKDDVQSFDFTRTITFDNVTGEITETTPWNVTSHTFGYRDTPVIDGYHADKRNAGGSVVTPDDLNKTVTVTYTQNGKIIPVDPNGKPIPNVPTPTYPTDPSDPTKVTPDEPVPNVPGYTPSTPTVTPKDPGKDTPVPYNNGNTPVNPDVPTPQPEVPPTNPTTPTTPTTPDEPTNVTPHAETPSEPEQPSDDNDTVKPHAGVVPTSEKRSTNTTKTVAPHAQNGVRITKNGNIINSKGHTIGYVDDNGKVRETLPQTGDSAELAEAEAILGGIAAGLGMIGLAGSKKRRRN